MTKKDIKVGECYLYKHVGGYCRVKVIRTYEVTNYNGRLATRWVLHKFSTKREIIAKSAMKFQPLPVETKNA